MANLTKVINNVQDKEDFLNFLKLLVDDLKANPQEWENKSLESYLEAVMGWTEDMEGYYENTNQPLPSNINWKIFADILMAAKIYE